MDRLQLLLCRAAESVLQFLLDFQHRRDGEYWSVYHVFGVGEGSIDLFFY